MIDQIRQAAKTFEGSYRQYHISLRLTPEENLEIRMRSDQTADQYYLLVDHEYIKNEKDFINIIEMPIDILMCFHHHFENVTVYNGIIRLKYELGTIRKIVKNFSFKTMKQGQVKKFSSEEVEKMKEGFWNLIAKKEMSIHQLQQRLKLNQKRSKDILQRTKAEYQKTLILKANQYSQLEKLLKQNQQSFRSQLRKLKKQSTSELEKKNTKIAGMVLMAFEYETLKKKFAETTSQVKELSQLSQKLQKDIQIYQNYVECVQETEKERKAISNLESTLGRNRWRKINTLRPGLEDINVLVFIISVEHVEDGVIALVADETGTVSAHLDKDKRIKVGHTIAILDAEMGQDEGSAILMSDTVNRINFQIKTVNTEYNVSTIKW